MALEKSHIALRPGSEKSFGIIFGILFLLIGSYPLLYAGEVRWWSLGLAAGWIAITLVYPSLLRRPNYWWFRFGILLGSIVAPLVMALVYVTTVIPLGIFVRIFGKDLLRQKLDQNAKSYWIVRENPPQPMRNQF